MITGFNTDIEYEGVVYHVQTEDKGLSAPVLISQVFVGGAILAVKRAPYNDLVEAGFDELVLAERLQRQHKLICAAICAGRIDDLKQMSQREAGRRVSPVAEHKEAPAQAEEIKIPVRDEAIQTAPPIPPAKTAPPTVRADIPNKADFARVQETSDALYLSLLEERELRAGEVVTLRIRVSHGPAEARDAVPDAPVTVKILGTDFRPLVLSAATDRDGVAIIHAWLPNFTKGRAAILIRAVAAGYEAELRRIISHA